MAIVAFSGSTGGNYNTAGNWTPARVPLSTDIADLTSKTVILNVHLDGIGAPMPIAIVDSGSGGQLTMAASGKIGDGGGAGPSVLAPLVIPAATGGITIGGGYYASITDNGSGSNTYGYSVINMLTDNGGGHNVYQAVGEVNLTIHFLTDNGGGHNSYNPAVAGVVAINTLLDAGGGSNLYEVDTQAIVAIGILADQGTGLNHFDSSGVAANSGQAVVVGSLITTGQTEIYAGNNVAIAEYSQDGGGTNTTGYGMAVGIVPPVIAAVNGGSPSTTVFNTTLPSANNGDYVGLILTFTGGVDKSQSARIITYSAAAHTVTVDKAFVSAPGGSDSFVVTRGGIGNAMLFF